MMKITEFISRKIVIEAFSTCKVRLILLLVSVLSFSSLITKAATQATFYVDPVNGNDTYNGLSVTTPFKTIIKARNIVRQLAITMSGDIHVVLRGGLYMLDNVIDFDDQDSGLNGYSVFYEAFPNERPVLAGGRFITGWTLYDAAKNIWKASCSCPIQTRQLFVNDRRAVRARSTGGLTGATYDTLGHKTTDRFMINWKNQSNIEMVYNGSFTSPRCAVSKIQALGTDSARIIMNAPGWKSVTNNFVWGTSLTTATTPWFYENAYELIDQAGEWYLDPSGSVNGAPYTFYYKAYPAENMSTAVVVAPVLEQLVTIKGRTINTPVHNFNLTGIIFQHTTWLEPSINGWHYDAQNNVIRGNNLDGNHIIDGAALTLKYANNINILRCQFTQLGGTGINMYAGCNATVIQGCKFTDISANGIQMGDYLNWKQSTSENGMQSTITAAKLSNNVINNNYVYRCGADYRSSNGVATSWTQNLNVTHNEIAYMPYGALHIGWGWTTRTSSIAANNNFKQNYIHDILQELWDIGGIYTLGPQGTTSASISKIDSNYLHSMPDHGLYFDNGSSWYTANNNVLTDIAIKNVSITTPDKHDITVTNTYADDNAVWNSGTNTTVQAINVVTNGAWPVVPQQIINNAGLEPGYIDLRGKEVLNENYNLSSIGTPPLNWVTVTTGGTIYVADLLNNGDRSVILNKPGLPNNVYCTRTFMPFSGKVTVAVRIRTDSAAYWKNAPNILDKSGNIITSIIFRGGNIQIPEPGGTFTTVQAFIPGQWYDLKVVLNTEVQKYDVYINGILKVSQDAFFVSANDISQVQFKMNVNNSGLIYFDNLNVYADRNYLNDNFNTTTTGVLPFQWTSRLVNNGAASTAEIPSSSDKSMKLSIAASTDSASVSKTFDPAFGRIAVSFRVKADQISGWNNTGYLMDGKGGLAVCCIFKDGHIQLYKGSGTYTELQTFNAGQWYSIKLILNTETGKVDAYVDGVSKVVQDTFRTSIREINTINFSPAIGNLYVDDVQIFNQSY